MSVRPPVNHGKMGRVTKVEGGQGYHGNADQGHARRPYRAYEAPKFKENKEGCEKYVFTTGSGEKKQAEEFIRALEGLFEYIERDYKIGQEIARAIQMEVDVNTRHPNDMDPKDKNAFSKWKEG